MLTYHNIDDEDAEVDPDNVTNDTDHVDIDQDEATNKDDTPDEEADDIDTTTTATNDDEDSTQDEMFDWMWFHYFSAFVVGWCPFWPYVVLFWTSLL